MLTHVTSVPPDMGPGSCFFWKSRVSENFRTGRVFVGGKKLIWPVAKLFGITYLVGKIEFKLFFSGSIG